MLIEFRFKNYRSFRDEAVLSMEATGLSSFKSCLIPLSSTVKLLPAIAIYGKNGGGKSNVIRAFWLAVQFIRNAQRTQHERAAIPVNPFALNDYSKDEPTGFAFEYTSGGVKYWYGFAATREKIYAEYLYHAPKGQKALVFKRTEQHFDFTEDKSKRALIGEMVAENQLFFSVACTMNDAACVAAMRWFRDQVFFSRDYSDIPRQLIEYSEDKNMLRAISDYAKAADLGILDMQFEFNSNEIQDDESLPDNIPEGIKAALVQFMHTLAETSNNGEVHLKMGEVSAKASHQGENRDGRKATYSLELSDESDGTRKLMALRVVNSDVMTAFPSSTCSVLTTDSLAIKPEISAVAQRQSPKPSGLNSTASHWPISASRLSALSVTTFSRVSKLCRNQMTTVARKMTVNARCKKSLAFSHSSSPTLLADGSR